VESDHELRQWIDVALDFHARGSSSGGSSKPA
jgi:hypothetical protein